MTLARRAGRLASDLGRRSAPTGSCACAKKPFRGVARPFWLTIVFIATRAALALTAANVAGDDVQLYVHYAHEILGAGLTPYADIPIEYPPAAVGLFAVPVVLEPLLPTDAAWVMLMLCADVAGYIGLLRLGRRLGTTAGAWWWVLLIAALGPLVYRRLDIVPAVTTIWAWERTSSDRFLTAGALLGIGVATKLWPVAVAILLVIGMRKQRLLLLSGMSSLIALSLLPVLTFGALPALAQSVIGYHMARGLQVESTWASALLTAKYFAYPVDIATSYGAAHLVSPVASTLKAMASASAGVGLALGCAWARVWGQDNLCRLMTLTCAAMLWLLAVGSVLSPQYVIWAIACVAVAESQPTHPLRKSAWLLMMATVLTHALVARYYLPLVNWQAEGLAVLLLRNFLLVMACATAGWACVRRQDDPVSSTCSAGDVPHPRKCKRG